MKTKLIVVVILFFTVNAFGQYAQYQFNDTTKAVYPYKLPIMGKLAFENGFDLMHRQANLAQTKRTSTTQRFGDQLQLVK